MSEHFLSFLHDGCALCGEEWPCRTVLMQEAARRLRDDEAQLAAERQRAEAAEQELALFMARRESDGTCTIGCGDADHEDWLEYHSPACMWQQVLNLRADRQAAEGRDARLRGSAGALEAWAGHVISIVRERRVPSADVVADGEAIIGLLRAALAGTPEGEPDAV